MDCRWMASDEKAHSLRIARFVPAAQIRSDIDRILVRAGGTAVQRADSFETTRRFSGRQPPDYARWAARASRW
jgi:hypothetical protein